MKKITIITTILSAAFFVLPSFALAAAPFTETFDSYANSSSLNGQGGWTASGISVQTAGCETGEMVSGTILH